MLRQSVKTHILKIQRQLNRLLRTMTGGICLQIRLRNWTLLDSYWNPLLRKTPNYNSGDFQGSRILIQDDSDQLPNGRNNCNNNKLNHPQSKVEVPHKSDKTQKCNSSTRNFLLWSITIVFTFVTNNQQSFLVQYNFKSV